jgi:preprotein translocase subunit YajC
MLISPAYAQAAGATPGFGLAELMPLVIIFVVFYVLLIRPQQRKVKAHREMVEGVRRGDTVVTGGGIVGKVIKVGEGDDITVEIAEGVKIQVVRSTLADVRNRTEPAKPTGGEAVAPSQKGGLLGSLFGFGRKKGD